jgi:nitrogen-specific signal transduction histidine kinase
MVSASSTVFLLLVGYAAAIGLGASLGAYALTRRDNPIARSFGGVMVAVLVWSFGAFGRLLAPSLAGWRALTVLMYLSVATTPLLFFLFVTYYTDNAALLTRGRVAALLVVPAITVVAVATNQRHGLFFTAIETGPLGGGDVPIATSGPLFGLHAAYSYVLLAVATLLLLSFAIRTHSPYRRQSIAIFIGAAIPWLTNAAYLIGLGPAYPADPTPVGFAVGGVALAYAVFGPGVTNLTPVARSAVVDAIDEAVCVIGWNDEVVDMNPAARRLTEVPEPLGDPVSTVIPDGLLEADEEPKAVTVDGTRRWFRLREVDLPRAGAVLLATDLTEQIRSQRQLREQNERLEQFTKVAAHDLRNPLNAVTGYVNLARETDDVSHLDQVDPAIRRIETLIDDLLTLGEEGQVVEDTVPLSIAAAARRVWRRLDTDDATLDVETDVTMLADGRRIAQLLENLFSNALTHGGDGVTVTVGRCQDGFYVADDGEGIPATDRADVFEYGFSTHDGTGLGLPVVRSIAVAHGWTVHVTDGADGGARFEFTSVDTDPEPGPDRNTGRNGRLVPVE